MSEENEIRLKHLVIDMGDGTTLELSAEKAKQLYAALKRVFGESQSISIGGGGGSNIREFQNCFPSRGEGIVKVRPWTGMPDWEYPPPASSSDVATDDNERESDG